MAAGNIYLQANAGNVITINAQDGDSGVAVIPSGGGLLSTNTVSKVASNVLLSGNVAVANSVITKSNANVTYTGKGTTQDIVTGIASVDFTVASNGSGYYHDRVAGDCIVKDDAGTIIESGSCVVNTSKVHIKSRSLSDDNMVFDGIRGPGRNIRTNSSALENDQQTNNINMAFTSTGISFNTTHTALNNPGTTYIAHQTLYTHIMWGLTNQGKRYITAYNPVTREVMTMYQGSGIVGHQIPNPLSIKLDYLETKDLDSTADWLISNSATSDMKYNTAANDGINRWNFQDTYTEETKNSTNLNAIPDNTYISYGFANSETKIILPYNGTALAGNFVETRDVNGVAKKPRRAIIRRADSTGSWLVHDSERPLLNRYSPRIDLSTSDTEDSSVRGNITIQSTGMQLFGYDADDETYDYSLNVSGGRYIAIVEFDTTASNDDTYFDLPTDNTNLSVTNGKLAFTNGRSSNGGYKVETQDFTGSVDFSGISDGIKYIARDKLGNVFGYDNVSIGLYNKTSADDNRLVFDTESGKWYTTTGGELVTNGTFDTDTSGWTSGNGAILSFENGTIKVAQNLAYSYANQAIPTEVGKRYTVKVEGIAGNYNSPYTFVSTSLPITNNASVYDDSIANIETSTGYLGTKTFDFIAETTVTYINIGIPSQDPSLNVYFDNISVYKVEATLDTELPNPICFIDDKPYQVTSGTPMDRLVDYPSIPKNVMESTYVDGMLISNGNRKIIELGTIFNNNRYVIDNPFGNDKYMDCDVKFLYFVNGEWVGTDWVYIGGQGSYGTVVYSQLEGIVVITGSVVIAANSVTTGSGSLTGSTTTSAPARVIVTYVGVTK